MNGLRKAYGRTAFHIRKNASTILTATSAILTVVTVCATVKSTNKVAMHKQEFKEREEKGEVITKKEKYITYAKDIALPVTTGLLSAGTLYLGHKKNRNDIKALGSILSTSIGSQNLLTDKVKDRYGEEKADDLTDPVVIEEPAKGKKKATGYPVAEAMYNCVLASQTKLYVADNCDDTLNNIKAADEACRRAMSRAPGKVLTFNHMCEIIGWEAGRNLPGSGLGWTPETWNGIHTKELNVDIGSGNVEYVMKWKMPTPVYQLQYFEDDASDIFI